MAFFVGLKPHAYSQEHLVSRFNLAKHLASRLNLEDIWLSSLFHLLYIKMKFVSFAVVVFLLLFVVVLESFRDFVDGSWFCEIEAFG
jgi:hypothetical protein